MNQSRLSFFEDLGEPGDDAKIRTATSIAGTRLYSGTTEDRADGADWSQSGNVDPEAAIAHGRREA